MLDFSMFVTFLWLLYVGVNWIYLRFAYKYMNETLIVLDTPPTVPAKRVHTIPIEAGDWLKIYSHEYGEKYNLYYTRPLVGNLEQQVKNIYPSIAKKNVNLNSISSSIALYRNDAKLWEMYLYEADGLVVGGAQYTSKSQR